MAITVNQIAEICGVSRTTVLRTLNGKGSVRKETREKILAVARENNYRPNLLARSLNHGRTKTIGVVTVNMENLYFVQRLDAINRTAEKQGFFTNIAVCDESLEEEKKLIQGFADRQVEGIIISPMNKGKEFESFLKSVGIPCVCMGNRVSDAFTNIQIDERKAAYDAFSLIANKGYEKVIFVCPPLEHRDTRNIYVHLERMQGVREAQRRHQEIALDIIDGEEYLEKVKEFLIDSSRPKSAFLCSGDIYALEIMTMARNIGMQIPDDFGLMGFDDLSMLRFIDPKLSTVSTNVQGMASAAVKELISAIEDDQYEPRTISLNYKILDRETL